ncbi:MAG TPA: ABC transporter permease [Nocardioidaceae bacterium]|nr:ABC transporter permease [Nocardioidaceae bacterium]
MTAIVALPEASARPAPVLRGYRFELVKLLSQWRIRLLLLACWIAPAGFVAVVSQQSALPTDTVFGRWMHATGWSGSLVVLGFSCAWVLPLLTALVAGDVFALEDRLGTWRHLMVAVRSPRRIFVAKAFASLTVILLLMAGLTVSGIVGGLLAVGHHPLVGLDGHLLAPADAASTVLLAWLCVLPPTLAFAAVGLLGSVALGRSPMGLLMPALLAFVLQLAQLLPLPVTVRFALPSHAFLAWRGLFTDPAQTGPLVIGIVVSLAWAVVATALAYWLFLRRDFTDLAYEGSGRRVVVAGVLPLAGLVGLSVAVVASATTAEGTGVEKATVESSLATAFAHLYRLQTEQLNRPAVTARHDGLAHPLHPPELTENIATPPPCGLDDPAGPATAKSVPVPAGFVSYSAAWERWAAKQHLSGKHATPDFANPEQMNRYTWYDAHHWELPYPGDPKIYLPSEVPGAALPGSEVD